MVAGKQIASCHFSVNKTIKFMFAGTNMFWARLRLIQNEPEKGPKHVYAQEHKLYYYYQHFGGHWEKKRQQNSLNNHASIYKLNGFYFPSMKIHKSWLEITKSCHLSFQKFSVENMKGKFDNGYLSVEINIAIAKVTVLHNWLNRVRLAWSRKTYTHLATGHRATTRGTRGSFSESASIFCQLL